MSLIEKFYRRAVESGLLAKFLNSLPRLSKLCTIFGILWLFVYLPMDGNFRNTYFSENALMPNQAYSYFRESEWNNVRGFRNEIHELEIQNAHTRNSVVHQWLEDYGLKPALYKDSEYGDTLYAVLNAQRGDGTEAMVITAPWYNGEGAFNTGGLALSIGLMRFFANWPVWSKNIILVVPENPGPPLRSWVEAYHTSLPLTAGTIESAVVVDYPGLSDYVDYVDIEYAGMNGVLPNLDLLNIAVHIIEHEGLKVSINGMPNSDQADFQSRSQNVLMGIQKMATAGLDNLQGHECFSGWRIQAMTLKAKGNQGPYDITTYGRVIEATFRSVNNMMEKFHQSFFFYLLLSPKWFVSIASYLPAAILLSVSFALSSVDAMMKTTYLTSEGVVSSNDNIVAFAFAGLSCLVSFLIVFVAKVGSINPQFFLILQVCLVFSTKWLFSPSKNLHFCLKSIAFLYLSIVLTSLLVVNFALAFVIGVLAFPMTLVNLNSSRLKNMLFLLFSNPFIATFLTTSVVKDQLRWEIFDRLIFASDSLGCWTWYILCIGWYTPWMLLVVANNTTVIDAKSVEQKKED